MQEFTLDVPQAALDDLAERLDRTRWPSAVEGGWARGTDPQELRELVDHWRDGFDWRAQEARLNAFANHRVELDGLGVHLIHERGVGPDPLPLVVTHGWPSSVLELLDLIPLLTDPGAHGGDPADAFTVAAPTLPGFGLSDAPQRPGMSQSRIADLWARLMVEELGYERFGAHGGDIGTQVTIRLCAQHPERIVGAHVLQDPDWGRDEIAYALLQSTKPQTLAYALTDSPVGLAAWMVEKLTTWSRSRLDRDRVLATVALYWFTAAMGSSVQLYYETSAAGETWGVGYEGKVEVPSGIAMVGWSRGGPSEKPWGDAFTDLRRATPMPRGGHFLAWEEPQLLAEELRAFFRPLRGSDTR